ncbi:MAG: sulfotransferase [Gammaproteobacteria bacterium]|nr:sulfotransferase [Gammaproteobacteria bacterium]
MARIQPSQGISPIHLAAAAPLGVWLRLIRENGGVAPPYWGRLARVMLTSAALSPLRAAERVRFGRRVARTEVHPSPVYVHGFARTGTTHLHNLLAHDPGLGFVTTLQANTAPMFLFARGWLDPFIAKRLPSTRPMDDVAVSLALPQEEEAALACTSHLSPVHGVSFPNRMREITDRFGSMRLTAAELAQWKRAYLRVLRKATLAAEGRRLVLKSPANLGRTALLRSLFPDAKFVFLMRNPYVVYLSNLRLYRSLLPAYAMTDYDWDSIAAAVRRNFAVMMQRYLRDRESIPPGNLVEVRFEDVEADPLGELERIYRRLRLPGWERARQPIAAYAASLAGYRKNRYRIDQRVVRVVDRDWGFAVKAWGYSPPFTAGRVVTER